MKSLHFCKKKFPKSSPKNKRCKDLLFFAYLFLHKSYSDTQLRKKKKSLNVKEAKETVTSTAEIVNVAFTSDSHHKPNTSISIFSLESGHLAHVCVCYLNNKGESFKSSLL